MNKELLVAGDAFFHAEVEGHIEVVTPSIKRGLLSCLCALFVEAVAKKLKLVIKGCVDSIALSVLVGDRVLDFFGERVSGVNDVRGDEVLILFIVLDLVRDKHQFV